MSMRISVVTVAYNEKATIETTLDCVFGQSYDNIEYIIVDGGSSDGTVAIIEKYAKKLAFWSSERDRGIYDGMNKGLARCSGEYVIFCNAGDCFASRDTIAHLVQTAEKNHWPDLVFGDCGVQTKSGLMVRSAHGPGFMRIGMPAAHESMMYKMDVIRRMNLKYDISYRIAADYKFTFEFVRAAGTFAHLAEPVIVFSEGGVSTTHQWRGLMETNRVRKEVGGLSMLSRMQIVLMQCVALCLSTYAGPLYRRVRLRKAAS